MTWTGDAYNPDEDFEIMREEHSHGTPPEPTTSMNREEMTDALVERDLESIIHSLAIDDIFFLDAVLRGDGWIPYNQLTDAQLKTTYDEVVA